MNSEFGYRHTQRAILCLIVYATAGIFVALGWALWNEPHLRWLFLSMGLLLVVLGTSFHHLTVEGKRDHLSIHLGPIQSFRRTVRYEDISSVDVGRTTILDGWGIHRSLRGGWVWNLWGRDCVVLKLRRGSCELEPTTRPILRNSARGNCLDQSSQAMDNELWHVERGRRFTSLGYSVTL